MYVALQLPVWSKSGYFWEKKFTLQVQFFLPCTYINF